MAGAEHDVRIRRHDGKAEGRPRSKAPDAGTSPALRYVDAIRKPGPASGAAGPGARRTVLVTDGPFAETREQVG